MTIRRTCLAPATLALAALLSGCTDQILGSYDYGSLEVRVSGQGGEPVPGAEIELYSPDQILEVARTGEDGTLRFGLLPFGNYGVRVTDATEGYFAPEGGTLHRDALWVGEGKRVDVGIELVYDCCASVRVSVQEPDGTPVPGVALQLYNRWQTRSATAGADGRYAFVEVPGGSYGVSAAPPSGYQVLPGGKDHADGLDLRMGRDTSVTLVFARTGTAAGAAPRR